jgi:DNA-binding NtrC family response regulator
MLDDLPAVMRDTGRRSSSAVALPPPGALAALPDNNPLARLDLARLLDTQDFSVPLADRLAQINDHIEKFLIEAALAKCHGHRQETADCLGMSRKSLHNKMVRFGLFEGDKSSVEESP